MAQAEISPIEVAPLNPMETKEVLLSPPTPPDGTIFCTWFRKLTGVEAQVIVTLLLIQGGVNETGPAYTERETVYPNCSLHIKELRLSDNAIYMLSEGGAISNMGNISLNVQRKTC